MDTFNIDKLAIESAILARDTCLFSHLRKVDRLIMQLYDELLRPYGLKATQFTLLVAIRLREPVRQTDLADCTATDRTTLTRNLSSLERQGLVQTQPGTDRRVKEISLTPQGHQRLTEAYPHWRQAQAQAEGLLGKHRVRQSIALLDEIARQFGVT